MKRSLTLLVISYFVVGCSLKDEDSQWWMSTDFKMREGTYEGIPMGDLPIPLKRLQILDRSAVPNSLRRNRTESERCGGYRFGLELDLDQDGSMDVIKVGVGEMVDGRDVSVLFYGPKDNPMAQRMDGITEAQVSFLYPSDRGFGWFWCCECDYGKVIEWNSATKTFDTRSTGDGA